MLLALHRTEMARFQQIKNLVCLVTGGASGLGRATCERLVERGAKVVVADITQSEGEKLVERLGKQSAVFTHCDVTNTQHVEKALQIARERFGQLDVAVSNAGVVDKGRTYASKRDTPHSMASFNRIMNVNVVGAFNVARLAAQMIAKNQPDENGQRGVIIMTASIAAYVAEPGLTAYAGSKGAVASMTLPMARDLADQGIRVVSIAPGLFQTPMYALGGAGIEEHKKTVPFPKRTGHPSEFAHLVEGIISNPMLNGCVMRIDAAYN